MNVRDIWQAKGSNFDPARLSVYTNESGFILGLSKLGEGRLGPDGADVLLPATSFTEISIGTGTNVESGLFVQREVQTCTLRATLPGHVDLKNKRLAVKYDGVEIYKGTVREVSWTETMDNRYWLPGNTATKAYQVEMLLTSGEEAWADAKAPVRVLNAFPIEQRFEALLGISCDGTQKDPASDINPEAYNNIYHSVITFREHTTTGDENLVDVLRGYTKIANMHYIYKPWDEVVELRNNAGWHSGSSESDALVFSDNGANDAQAPSGDDFLHGDRYVMYSSRTYEENAGYYQGSAKVQAQWDVLPATVYGPYRASEINPSDTLVDVGVSFFGQPDAMARNYAATLPLKRESVQFSKTITMPMQSYRQFEDIQIPGMALLEHNGVTERVAVLGMSQSISSSGQWMVSYDLGPAHLLDRYSDLDPSPPTNGTATIVGANVVVTWHTPINMPTDSGLYWYVWTDDNGVGDGVRNVASWSTDMTVAAHGSAVGQAPGDAQSTSFVKPVSVGAYTYYVAYTSDPTPGSGVANQSSRQGQPHRAGTIVI